MVTDDERREVALALDDLAERMRSWSDAELRDAAGLIESIDGYLFDFGPNGADAIVKRLAELIEPEPERTCHPVSMDWVGNPPYNTGSVCLNSITTGCSECGAPWKVSITSIPKFCPNCGAKVVSE